ncbi:MAG: hypothetical protein KJ737_27720 [Proteobacteria bacterium]|nr:hypothetical protein [Pseudomonadota bacterium]
MAKNGNEANGNLFIKKILSHYRKFLSAALAFVLMISIVLFAIAIFFISKHHGILLYMVKNGYTYHTSAEVMIKVNSPVSVNSPIKKVLRIPVKQNIHARVPVKTTVRLPIEQTFVVDLKKPVAIKIDHKFPIHDVVAINFTAPIDTDVMVKAFGVSKKVQIIGGIPIKFDVPISKEFIINDTFMLKINDPINVPISHVFEIPVETEIEAEVPIDLLLDVPIDTKIDTKIMIQGDVPVLIDFEINFDLWEGITIKGIRMNPASKASFPEHKD